MRDIAASATNILKLIRKVYDNKHPMHLKLIKDIVAAFSPDSPNKEADDRPDMPKELQSILDEIHQRELPPLEGHENEYPENTFFNLYYELDELSFYRIFTAYCETQGINWSSLVQYIPWLNQ